MCFHVERHGVDAAPEHICGRLVAMPLGEHPEKPHFVRCEVVRGMRRRPDLAKQRRHAARDLVRHRRPAGAHILQTLDHDLRLPGAETDRSEPEPVGARGRFLDQEQRLSIDPDQVHDQASPVPLDDERRLKRRQPARVPGRLYVVTNPAIE